MQDKKIISLQAKINKTKVVAGLTDEDAQSILSDWFLIDFEIVNEGGLYKAYIRDNSIGLVTIETLAAHMWMSIYEERLFAQLSDIICTYLSVLSEKREFIDSCFVYVDDGIDPDESKPCTVITDQGIIYENVNVVIKKYGDASELEFYLVDEAQKMFCVEKWYQEGIEKTKNE